MSSLTKWPSVRDVTGFTVSFETAIEDPLDLEEGSCDPPALESYRTGDAYVVRVDLPGVDPKDVHLVFENGYLAIEGGRKRAIQPGELRVLKQGVCYGSFRRTLYIPGAIKGEEVTARYQDGVLEITAPVDEKSLPLRIKVEEVAA